jgi:VWFA-related protein
VAIVAVVSLAYLLLGSAVAQAAADNRPGDVGNGWAASVSYTPRGKAENNPLNIGIGQVNIGAFPTIQCFVSVWDATNQGIQGLTEANFALTEKAPTDPQPVLQTISIAEAGAGIGGIAVALVMDRSGSMDGTPIQQAKSAAISFIDNFSSVDRAAIVDFASNVHTACPYTFTDQAGKTSITNAVNPLYAYGSTALNDAIVRGIDLTAQEVGAKAVIAFTDGGENYSSHTDAQVISTALAAGIPVYTIGISSFDLNTTRLQNFATDTGGQYYLAPSTADLLSVYQAIKAHVLSQYIVTYRTANAVQDNSTRTVTITVNASSNTATAQTTYKANLAPQITRTVDTIRLSDISQPAGGVITIAADVFDYDPIVSARLFYRITGSGGAYQQVAMTAAKAQGATTLFEATIPAANVITPGLDYFLTASDGLLTVSSPATNPDVYPYKIPVIPNFAPVIQHVPVTYAPPDLDVAITATVTDITDRVDHVTLFYRSAATTDYVAVTMNNTQGDTYECAIPASAVVSPGVDYYLLADDNFGTASYHGTADSPHRINYGASDVTIAARWDETTKRIVITALAYDRMQGGTVTFGSGVFTVYDPKTAVVAEGSMKYDLANANWTSGAVPFDHTGQFTAEVSINGLFGTISFVTGLQTLIIDGTAFGQDGSPLADAEVSLYSALGDNALASVTTDEHGNFVFGPGYVLRTGWYYLAATKGTLVGRTVDFFASDSMTVNVTLSQNNALAVAYCFLDLNNLLDNTGLNENKMLSDMSGSVDNYLKEYSAVGVTLDVVNFGLSLYSVGSGALDLYKVAGADPFTDTATALRYLKAFVDITKGTYGTVKVFHPWFTRPPFTQDFKFEQWYEDWEFNDYFRSVADSGFAFNGKDWWPWSHPPGDHFISTTDLDSDSPFTDFTDALAATDSNLLQFFRDNAPSPAFSPDKARAYIASRINQLNVWLGHEDKRSQIVLYMPESLSSDAMLAMRPMYARYQKDRATADALFAAKILNTGVKIGALAASLTGPVAIAVGAGTFAASVAIDCAETQVKGDLEQQWGLAGPTRLLDLVELTKYGAGMSEFLQTEANRPYYLDASKTFSSAIDSVQTSFDSTGMFGLPKTSVVLVDVAARNTGDPAVINLYAENYATEALSALFAYIIAPPVLLPFLTGDFEVKSFTDSGIIPSGTQVPRNGTVEGHFELLTGTGFLAQLMDIQFLDVFTYNGPWISAEKPVPYNLIVKELKNTVPAKANEPSSMIRVNEKALSLKAAADMADRVIDQQYLTLDVNNTSFTGSYTASADAHRIVFQLFHPASANFGLMVSQQDGARVGFDPAIGAQFAEFPATYSGSMAHPEEVDVPGAAGKTYAVKITLAQSAAREAERATLVVIEEPQRPAVMAFYPQDVVKYATPGSRLTLATEVAESGKQIPLDNLEIAISALTNQGGAELPLSADTPAQITVPRLMAGTSTGASFTYMIPNDATGIYVATTAISSKNAGALTQSVEVHVDTQAPDTSIISAPSGNTSFVVKWTGSDSETPADQLRFSWRLDGVDADWTSPAQVTETNYENLADGQYVFHVKTVDLANHEDPTPAEATIKTHFDLTVTSEGNGDVALDPAGGAYDAGALVSLTATRATGWRFDHWEGAVADPAAASTTVTVNADMTVMAVFIQQFVLSVAREGEGTVTPDVGDHTYDVGTVVALTAAPARGWRFDHWERPGSSVESTETNVLLDSDETITAVFVRCFLCCFGSTIGDPNRSTPWSSGLSGDMLLLVGAGCVLLSAGRRKSVLGRLRR